MGAVQGIRTLDTVFLRRAETQPITGRPARPFKRTAFSLLNREVGPRPNTRVFSGIKTTG